MKIESHLKYGEQSNPWKPTLLTAILQWIFLPIVILLTWIIGALAVLLDLASVGSMHITFTAISKKVQMPDGTIKMPI